MNVAIVGATGAVGREFINILQERDFPLNSLKLLASNRSAGKKLPFKGFDIIVEELTRDSFHNVDIALFSAGSSISLEFAPIAAQSGAVVVDNSSAFRMNDDVPLVVPEVNPGDISKHKGIIANPNCSTIQMVVALKPLHDHAKIKRVIVTTFQSVSGTGQAAIDELSNQSYDILNGKQALSSIYQYQIAFNVLPHIDDFLDNGFTKEEIKMTNETIKIMNDSSIHVTATAVRVPVFRGHSESVYIETESKITRDKAVDLLSKAENVVVQDDTSKSLYPLAIKSAGTDPCYVGRIREDLFFENGLHLWVVADNLRKGAALNAVQIAEKLI